MGGGASVSSLPTLTVEQVGELVAGCGDAYLPYRSSFIHAGIDGKCLLQLDEQNIHQQLIDLGLRDDSHIKTLSHRLLSAKHVKSGELPPFPKQGVTLKLLLRMKQLAKEKNWTTTELSENFIKPETQPMQCSFDVYMKVQYSDTPHPLLGLMYDECYENGPANVFVSHAWRYLFEELVTAIETFTDSHADERWSYWVDLFVNDQWNAPNLPYEWWAGTFSSAIGEIGHTMLVLSPWDAPIPLTRAWCLWEILCTIKMKAKLTVQLSTTQQAAFLETLRNDYDHIMHALCNIDVHKSEAWNPKDLEMIFAAVEKEEGGFAGVNNLLCAQMRDWLAENVRSVVTNVGDGTMGDGKVGPSIRQLADLGRAARVLEDQGKLDEAKTTYERALLGFEKALGPDHPTTLATVHNLGGLLYAQGKLDEAKIMWERVLVGFEKVLGPDHPNTLATVLCVGVLLKDQGKLDEAKTMYDRALAGYEKAMGPDHTSTLDMVNNLAVLLKDQGKLDEAKAMYERALTGLEKALGPDHTSTLSTASNIGELLLDQGKLDEAKTLLNRALQGLTKAAGPDHMFTLRTTHFLAEVMMKEGKYDEAVKLYDRAKQGREKVLGPDHPDTITTIKLFEECSLLTAGLAGATIV